MRLVAELGYAAAAIDFPNHGERRPEEERSVPAAQVRSAMGLVAWRQRNTQATEQAICDLRATVDFACERSDVNPDLVGYIGLSMGTRFGVPFVAAEPRLEAAMFGLFGWSADLRRPDEEGLAERSQAFASAARGLAGEDPAREPRRARRAATSRGRRHHQVRQAASGRALARNRAGIPDSGAALPDS